MTNKVLAKEEAILSGINLDFESAWIGPPDNDGFTPFGPDEMKDNIFQNLPQVNLHGMDEGLTLKMCVSILKTIIKEAKALNKKMKTTTVCRVVDALFIEVAKKMPSNKNVELGGRDGFKFFKHGVTSYMLPKTRRINGGWWISIARQLNIFLCVTKLISDATRSKLCDALSLLFEVHHGLRNPLCKDDLNSYQNKINFLLTALVNIATPWSKSQCQSIKFHWPRHWGHTRQVYTYNYICKLII
jgi:hypothetical protein